jgi:hypothetical protein
MDSPESPKPSRAHGGSGEFGRFEHQGTGPPGTGHRAAGSGQRAAGAPGTGHQGTGHQGIEHQGIEHQGIEHQGIEHRASSTGHRAPGTARHGSRILDTDLRPKKRRKTAKNRDSGPPGGTGVGSGLVPRE